LNAKVKVVLDANVLVSAAIQAGPSYRIVAGRVPTAVGILELHRRQDPPQTASRHRKLMNEQTRDRAVDMFVKIPEGTFRIGPDQH
jgi:hypothetical protein